MSSIKEAAEQFEPTTTKNISELESVSVDLELYEKTFKQGTPDEFTIKVTRIDDVEYRVPITVLADLKAILEKKPGLKEFAVSKSGQGMNTSYTVIPL